MAIFLDERSIYIYDVIGPEWAGMDSDADLVRALSEFKGKPVEVRINSPGGSADMGIAMYQALKRHDGEVTTVVDSLAASAASVAFLGGSKRYMATGSRLMIHEASTIAWGDASGLRKIADVLDKYNDDIVDIYAEVSGQDPDELRTMMADETWMSRKEAIAIGFAMDTVAEPDAKAEAKIVPQSWYKKTPQALLKPALALKHIQQRKPEPSELSRRFQAHCQKMKKNA
jgi:ATP-dependent Clp protease, protease subunit